MRILIPCLSFVTGLASSSPAWAGSCLSYNGRVTVEGTLVAQTFPGRPNYASIAQGDEPETTLIVRLRTPVCVEADAEHVDGIDIAAQNVQQIQLAFKDAGQVALVRKLAGSRIRLTGTLMGAISGHHHTPVLLQEVAVVSSSEADKPTLR